MSNIETARGRLIDALAAWHIDPKFPLPSLRVRDALAELDSATNGALVNWAIPRIGEQLRRLQDERDDAEIRLAAASRKSVA